MNRRILLWLLIALLVAAALAGCGYYFGKKNFGTKPEPEPKPVPKPDTTATLRFIVTGPHVLIMNADDKHRIKVFYPFDDEHIHEFRYGSPMQPPLTDGQGRNSYNFRLEDDGLQPSGKAPHVDHGLDDFNPEITRYYAPPKSFVSLDLPVPDLVTYIPPAELVRFKDESLGELPLNHVLEYKVSDLSKIKMISKELPNYSTPMTCEDLKIQYETYWKKHQDQPRSQRPYVNGMLTSCSQSKDVSTFYFAVGVPADSTPDQPYIERSAHAINYFNKKLLPILYGKDVINNPPPNSLVEINPACGRGPSAEAKPMLMSAVYRPERSGPRLVPVVSAENCTSPAATAKLK